MKSGCVITCNISEIWDTGYLFVHFLGDEKTNQKNHPLIKKILKFYSFS